MAYRFMWWWKFLEFIDIPLHIRRKRFIGEKVKGNIDIKRWKKRDPKYDEFGICTNVWRCYNPFMTWKNGMPPVFYCYELDGKLRTYFGRIVK